jgi:hypothetical protein
LLTHHIYVLPADLENDCQPYVELTGDIAQTLDAMSRVVTTARLAEEALLTAIAVSKQQTTRCFQLRAALSLAKLYQSDRPVDAHAVRAPALEGFSPSLEMPEIAEAMLLSARLA